MSARGTYLNLTFLQKISTPVLEGILITKTTQEQCLVLSVNNYHQGHCILYYYVDQVGAARWNILMIMGLTSLGAHHD